MRLGIDINTGLAFEGLSSPEIPSIPTPAIAHAKWIEQPSDWQRLTRGRSHPPLGWAFREDSFDSVTRIRRGRLYEAASTQPTENRVAPHPYEDPMMRSVGAGGRVVKSLYTYLPCMDLLQREHRGQGGTLALGSQDASSGWRIIQTELLANGDVMVTLKALTAYGIIPELNSVVVDERFRISVVQALNRAVEAAFRETPISVIDQCRNAVTVVLSRWLVQQGADEAATLPKDLGAVVKALEANHPTMVCARNLADVIARLHPRGKTNEQHAKQLRIPVEEDAELALQALGCVMRELGWART